MTTVEQQTSSAIRPFHVDFPRGGARRPAPPPRGDALAHRELVDDRSQGVQLATLQALCRYWATEYDLRRCRGAAERAAAVHHRDRRGATSTSSTCGRRTPDALPLIMTHGWPGSVVELLDSVGPLTDPTAHGGRAEDAFHLVLPSLPATASPREPAELGWDLGRSARAWAELMHRLGYDRYVAQGGDVGAGVTDAMGRQAPRGPARHPHQPARDGARRPRLAAGGHREERAALAAIKTFQASGNGYFVEQATRPQTIGYALLDSPVALAAWMLDHDTDAYYKIARAFVDGQPSGNLTRDHVLDNITLYWLTGTGASAARSYWEDYGPDAPGGGPPRPLPPPPDPGRLHAPSPARSGGPRAAGPRSPTPPSATSPRPTGAATSPPGRSPSCSRRSSGPRSARCASPRSPSTAPMTTTAGISLPHRRADAGLRRRDRMAEQGAPDTPRRFFTSACSRSPGAACS